MHSLVVRVRHHRGAVIMKQLDPLLHHRNLLRESGYTFAWEVVPDVTQIPHAVAAHRPDCVLLTPSWKDDPQEVRDVCARLAQQPARPALVLFDSYDPTSSPHFDALPFVDRYLKSKVLSSPVDYHKPYAGGHIHSDFVSSWLKYDLGPWRFGDPPPSGACAAKIVPCWNFGASSEFSHMARRLASLPRVVVPRFRDRPFVLNRRLALSTFELEADTWYRAYRQASLRAAAGVASHVRATGDGRITRRLYLLEMAQSKMVFSPFGWGEVCFRDYEAAMCGALLLKPAMDHVATSPDIFQPGRTYVPLRWDFADLHEKVTHFLHHPDEAQRIIDAARQALLDYHPHGFLADVRRCLGGLAPAATPKPVAEVAR